MVKREMTLADGRRLGFGLACLETGQVSPFDGRLATEQTLEVWSLAAGSMRDHPQFLACRFPTAAVSERHARAEHSRHGLPLRGPRGLVHLAPDETRWLLARLASGRLEEVEFVPVPRKRLSPLAAR